MVKTNIFSRLFVKIYKSGIFPSHFSDGSKKKRNQYRKIFFKYFLFNGEIVSFIVDVNIIEKNVLACRCWKKWDGKKKNRGREREIVARIDGTVDFETRSILKCSSLVSSLPPPPLPPPRICISFRRQRWFRSSAVSRLRQRVWTSTIRGTGHIHPSPSPSEVWPRISHGKIRIKLTHAARDPRG